MVIKNQKTLLIAQGMIKEGYFSEQLYVCIGRKNFLIWQKFQKKNQKFGSIKLEKAVNNKSQMRKDGNFLMALKTRPKMR